ncbi:unnamed protein product [Staurois parvus]|uniref:Uncharacterized protein n=1 Tax=Staurois parvus TaxID=386267 RepID=A0ABN9CQK2_9NEOB|nr:unnamed protein product [Staurois parvus]
MVLGRNGLACGVIKGLTVCCFTKCNVLTVSTLLCMAHMHSHAKQCAGADRGENCFVY